MNGGAGTDWFALHHQGGDAGRDGLTYTINSGNSSNFENIGGGYGDDVLTGDGNANKIFGGKGADTITGGSGNDILIGDTGASAGSDNLGSLPASGDHNMQYASSTNDTLSGGAGNDHLYGDQGDDTLDGGTGADVYSGGDGSDTFIMRVGDGGSTLADADTIKDFTDGTDIFGLDNDLLYTQLTIDQGTGSNSSDTIISVGSEYLMILTGIDSGLISEADLTPVDIT